MKNTKMLPMIVSGLLIAGGHSAHAALITTLNTPTTNMGSGFNTSLVNTINGNGLTPSQSFTAIHDSTVPSNSWVSAGALTGNITFDLGGTYSVNQFAFWNQNAGGPGFAGSTGINGVQVQFSADGTNFLNLTGGPTNFASAPGSTSSAQLFSFGPVVAKAFRFNVLSNYGDTGQTGFAEVAFNSPVAPVPEPSTWLMMFTGIGCMVAMGTRKRSKSASWNF